MAYAQPDELVMPVVLRSSRYEQQAAKTVVPDVVWHD
jgi:hypothetical protein